ncbi:MAG TPA: peptide-methionine (S)-S-oxide reductase MsrA [Saprospiraceae bacterium]|nr:peptide-methionine (S)-S-oxide reductase MsrA [Saprospiraceae bacterium]
MENLEEIIHAKATFGGGCFWCTEAVFQRVEGVIQVRPGYMGGSTTNPTYREICTGNTGHAEVIEIIFNPRKISYEQLLEIFWYAHDPTTLNRQGNDIGTQYRSVIFYHDESQKLLAEDSIIQIASKIWNAPIVTELSKATTFYEAETYHHNYYNSNSYAPYCRIVIHPKLDKVNKKFQFFLKNSHAE